MHNEMPTYDPAAVQPLREELIQVGFEDLFTTEEVDQAIQSPGTTLLVLNSVCGCSAGSARPGVCEALQSDLIPDRMVALFAGQEKAAVAHLRSKYLSHAQPSSPNIILFQGGKPVLFMERHHIQRMAPTDVAETLRSAFEAHCIKQGPSAPSSQFDQLVHAVSCGSTIKRMDGEKGSC